LPERGLEYVAELALFDGGEVVTVERTALAAGGVNGPWTDNVGLPGSLDLAEVVVGVGVEELEVLVETGHLVAVVLALAALRDLPGGRGEPVDEVLEPIGAVGVEDCQLAAAGDAVVVSRVEVGLEDVVASSVAVFVGPRASSTLLAGFDRDKDRAEIRQRVGDRRRHAGHPRLVAVDPPLSGVRTM